MDSHKVAIFDFSGIYDYEGFYREIESPYFISCRQIPGTNCLCDDMAVEEIKKLIKDFDLLRNSIRFIDSGNFHYMSKLLAEEMNEDFNLIVYDHHPDMQPSSFGNILSCGSWVMDLIDSSEYLKEVVIIGAAEHLIKEVDVSYKEKVRFMEPGEALNMLTESKDLFTKETGLPVYLSIDKDVLCLEDIVTNWDQGEMQANELYKQLEMIYNSYDVCATDICGECAIDQEGCNVPAESSKSSDINKMLYRIWHKYN
ncbi:MAG: arginase family protein [Butyrivibrio sp.]|nr:arginase family protein [Butyrivibrio sp.]